MLKVFSAPPEYAITPSWVGVMAYPTNRVLLITSNARQDHRAIASVVPDASLCAQFSTGITLRSLIFLNSILIGGPT